MCSHPHPVCRVPSLVVTYVPLCGSDIRCCVSHLDRIISLCVGADVHIPGISGIFGSAVLGFTPRPVPGTGRHPVDIVGGTSELPGITQLTGGGAASQPGRRLQPRFAGSLGQLS